MGSVWKDADTSAARTVSEILWYHSAALESEEIPSFSRCPGGEIGRHRRLKISRPLRPYRFDSGPGHHNSKVQTPDPWGHYPPAQTTTR